MKPAASGVLLAGIALATIHAASATGAPIPGRTGVSPAPPGPPLVAADTSQAGRRAFSAAPQTSKTNQPTPAVAYDAPKPTHIVTCRRDVDVDGFVKELGLKPRFIYHRAIVGFAAALDSNIVARLQQDSRVLAVESDGDIVPAGGQAVPDGIWRIGGGVGPPGTIIPSSPLDVPNFPVDLSSTNLPNINIAVMDTGIDLAHPYLNVVEAMDFADGTDGGNDWNGHGTLVAGIIGAVNNPSQGVVGVIPGARLWSIQVIGQQYHSWGNFLGGLDWLLNNAVGQVNVINMSLGGTPGSTSPANAIHNSILAAVDYGMVVVAAAGNTAPGSAQPTDLAYAGPGQPLQFGNSYNVFPAALPEVMAVSGMDPLSDTMWNDTNGISNDSQIAHTGIAPDFPLLLTSANGPFGGAPVTSPGAAIDVAGPAANNQTTYIGETYVSNAWGTSMAAPHAAGVVGLYILAHGAPTNANQVADIRQAIINNAQPQSQWNPNLANGMNGQTNACPDTLAGTKATGDCDGNFEPLVMPNYDWRPPAILAIAQSPPYGTNAVASMQISAPTAPGYRYALETTGYPGGPWEDGDVSLVYPGSPGTNTNSLAEMIGNGQTMTVIDQNPPVGAGFYRLK